MIYATSIYILEKDGEKIQFASEKDACDFVGVSQCTISSCFRSKCKCKGYSVNKIRTSGHGDTNTRLFKIWRGMIERCSRKNHVHYKSYGGRGIKVCQEWSNFITFKNWAIYNGYQDNLSIDRIDNNGNYCPENCRFVSEKEQQNNKRTNRRITYKGETKTLKQWSEKTGINYTTLKERLNNGWSIEKAMCTPVRKRRHERLKS